MGPKPTLNITDPKLIREILSKWETFQKLKSNPLARLVATGMVAYEGEQWVKARKIATPAFHLDKLKVCVYIYKSNVRHTLFFIYN